MLFDLSGFSGKCDCGHKHDISTREIIIESGAVKALPDIVARLQLTGYGCIICDENTLPYAKLCAGILEGFLHPATPMAVLNPDGLHADEKAVAIAERLLPDGIDWLLAAGSGTIHDITRYLAHKLGLPFISFPTAASVDGFVSTVSAMTWHGFKKTLPGVAPIAVVADSAVFSHAPYALTASGASDVLGKYISLADWKISRLVTGEELCKRICSFSLEAADRVREVLPDIRDGKPEAMEKLMYALLLSGIAMQMWGNSRPASGAEHHLSHLWEMAALNPPTSALHGEKVGVGLLIALERYKKLAAFENIESILVPYEGFPEAYLHEKLGELYSDIQEENTPDLLTEIDVQKFADAYPEIRRILYALPEPAALRDEMRAAGCKTDIRDIALSPDIIDDSLRVSPFVRRRLTMMRLSLLFRDV